MKLLFKNIRIISPNDNLNDFFNLYISNGIIEKIENIESILNESYKIIDGKDLVCAPGFFDMHVHFRTPGQTHKEDIDSGSNSAANGGFTGVVCMPNTSPAIDNPLVLKYLIDNSKNKPIDIFYSAAITLGRKGEQLTNMFELSEMGAILFTDDGDVLHNPAMMLNALTYAKTKNLIISQHCEEILITKNFGMNEGPTSFKLGLKGYPSVAEEIIISRDILLSEYAGKAKYHAQHISTKGSVELIRNAKLKGLNVTTEVCTHHFTLTDESLVDYDANYKMNPPLRTQKDIDELINGLKDGTIDCIVTDHAPHTEYEKSVEFENTPNGIIGLETSLGLSLTYLYHKGWLTLENIIEKMSINPRKILGLSSITISEGSEANLTIFNPNEEWEVNKSKFQSKSKNSPYDKWKLKGKPKYIVNKEHFYESNL